jgi:hypothetical protein
MKINLLKKELVFFITIILIIATMPYVTSNNYPKQSNCENNLVVHLTTDKTKYNIGEPIEITISVTNLYPENITLVFPSSQLADFIVKNEGNETVYQWSHDKYFYAVMTYATVPRGGTVEILNDKWEQVDCNGYQLPIGEYIVDGWMVRYNIHAVPVGISIVTPEFDIDYRHFYFGKLKFDVENIGDADAINVSWQIYLDVLTAPGGQFRWEGLIDNLSIGEVERISSDFFIFVGIPNIIIKLNGTNAEEYYITIRGLFFGPFIRIGNL